MGLVIGRMALSKAAVPFLLLAAGAAVAVISKWLGIVMMEDWGGRQALEAQIGDPAYPLESLLQVNLAGVEQSGSPWWLATSAPHAGTTLDLLHTSGTAAAVIGVCLLLGRLGNWVFRLKFCGLGAEGRSTQRPYIQANGPMCGENRP